MLIQLPFRHFIFSITLCSIFATSGLASKQPVEYVNPFIGTGGHGHTYPGATVPFGMVQLSPDIGKKGWDYCSGYHYSDSVMVGFSHTHLSGTGCEDLGDILFQPTIGIPRPDSLLHFPFDKKSEYAVPGYYSVNLPSKNIFVELTATERCGFHRYTFPKSDSACIIIDAGYGQDDTPLESEIKVEGADCITGHRKSSGWAWEQDIFFYAKFSKPFSFHLVKEGVWYNGQETKGKTAKAVIVFQTANQEKIMVRVGISAVSVEGAKKNLIAEINERNFDAVHTSAYDKWNNELEKILVESTNQADMETFYTALYHTMLAPTLFMDVNGNYRGGDQKIHEAINFDNYSTFSLWDTYRAEHPLFTVMHPDRVSYMVNSMLAFQHEYGYLPVWPLAGWETQCMIGYHSVPVITDAYLKGIHGFDAAAALEAMKVSAFANHKGLEYYNLATPQPIAKKLAELHANDMNSGFDYNTLNLPGPTGDVEMQEIGADNGYMKSISGETIDYHSSYPYVTKALLVRATTGTMAIEWETDTPQPNRNAVFMWLAGRSVNKGNHRFDLFVNGEKWFTFHTGLDTSDKMWTVTNANGSKLIFVATMRDVFDDQFGNMFLQIPKNVMSQLHEPLRLKIVGERGDSYDWYMAFEHVAARGDIHFDQPYAVAEEYGKKVQFVRVMIESNTKPHYSNLVVDSVNRKNVIVNPGLNIFDFPVFADEKPREISVKVQDNNNLGVEVENKIVLKPVAPLQYVPADKERESVSKTLEYAYDDWCIAQVAKKLNDTADYNLFTKRSGYYRNLYDSTTGFMRGRNFDDSWVSPFNPRYSTELQAQYTEGNAWQWTWSVQHDIPGLIKLMGGEVKFEQKLDSLFQQSSDLSGTGATADVSGLIGMYAHGNEPSHHISYLYNYIGKPYKTQELVRKIMHDFYTNKTDGLCGNEDCGQMSAWYVMSAMGFYPVNPVDGTYQLGSPLFSHVVINVNHGKTFTIDATNNSEQNVYIQSVEIEWHATTIYFD